MKLYFIMGFNKDNTIRCFREGVVIDAKIAEDLSHEDICLNGLGLVDNIGGIDYLVGMKPTSPVDRAWNSFLVANGGE